MNHIKELNQSMTIRETMHKSISLYRHSAVDLLRAEGMTLAVWAMCLCPLLFLLSAQTTCLALLCPLMMLLLALPMRQSEAEAMQCFLSGEPMASVHMLPIAHYGKKFLRSLAMLLLLTLWALPFLTMAIAALIAKDGGLDGSLDIMTLLTIVLDIGGGNLEAGVYRYVVAALLTLLLPLFGVMFHSGTRHAYALGGRKCLKGHRGKVILLWLCGLVFILPLVACLIALTVSFSTSVVSFTTSWFNDLTKVPSLSALMPPVWLLIATGVSALLLLLFNPMRALLPAIYLRGVQEEEGHHDTAA